MKQLVIAFTIVTGFVGTARADKVFRSGKGTAWDCKRDPVVSVVHGDGSYTFKGTCKSINVSGGHNKLTIESVESVNLTGSDNQLKVGAIDAINIVGSHNTVSYKSGVHGDAPSVNQVGGDNTVRRDGDGGGAAPAPAPADSPAAPAGAHDCAKVPTASINDGGGSYRFVGTCTKIVVNGGANTLTIENVQALTVTGSMNTITVGGVDKIGAPGSDNKISYRKGLVGAKPKISSAGEGNQITQVK